MPNRHRAARAYASLTTATRAAGHQAHFWAICRLILLLHHWHPRAGVHAAWIAKILSESNHGKV